LITAPKLHIPLWYTYCIARLNGIHIAHPRWFMHIIHTTYCTDSKINMLECNSEHRQNQLNKIQKQCKNSITFCMPKHTVKPNSLFYNTQFFKVALQTILMLTLIIS